MNKINKFLIKYRILFLFILLALLLRLPWLFTTIERDEGIFGYTAWRALSGDPLYYTEDNKPPLLYLLYALPISIFGNSIIPIRIFNNLLFLISIIFFFLLVKKEYGKKLAIPASIFYIFFMNLPASEGPLAVSESFMIPFFIISIYFFCLFLKKQKLLHLGLSIALMCFASLVRHNALGGLLLIYFLLLKKNKLKYREVFLMGIPFILFLISIIYFLYINQISDISNIILSIYTIRSSIPFEYSLLIILESSFLLLFTLVGITIVIKKKQIKKYLLIILWILFLIPFLFFPGSFHHILTFIPPLAIFAGLGFNLVLKRKKKRIFVLISILFLILSLFLISKQYPDYHFKLGELEIRYSDLEDYREQIRISKYLKNRIPFNETIFIWEAWEPGIYWLSERERSSRRTREVCEMLYLSSIAQEQSEKEFQHEYPKAILFFPNYPKKCKNITGKDFPNLLSDYYKEEIGNIEIYFLHKSK